MGFNIRQISRTSDGREIIRNTRIERRSIVIGRDAASDIHLADLAVELSHVTLSHNGDGSVSAISNGSRDFALDGRSLQSGEIDPAVGSEIRLGGFRLSISKDGDDIAVAVEKLNLSDDGVSDKDESKLFTLGAGRRKSAYVLIAAVLAVFLAWPIYSYLTAGGVKNRTPGFHADQLWTTGALSVAHAKLAKDCQACHTQKFVAVTDATCRTCHKSDAHDHATKERLADARSPDGLGGQITGFFKASFNRTEGGCVDCHTEHENEGRMAPTKQAFCTDCHSDLRSRLDDTVLPNVADFGTDHPQLKVAVTAGVADQRRVYRRVSLDTKPSENNGLIFPHALHLSGSNGVARMAQTMRGQQGWGAKLDCKDCHTPSADGTRFNPVDMESDCQMCHSLGFGGRDLKHGQPAQVVAQIRAGYGATFSSPPPSLSIYARRRPGDYAAVETAQDFTAGRSQLARQSGQAVRAVFARDGACNDCHIITPVPSNGAPVTFQPVLQPSRYMKKGWFDHDAHKDETCLSCHKAEASNRATDLLLPGIETCRNCHVGENGDKLKPVNKPIASGCALCHDYHIDDKAPWRSKLLKTRPMRKAPFENAIASAN